MLHRIDAVQESDTIKGHSSNKACYININSSFTNALPIINISLHRTLYSLFSRLDTSHSVKVNPVIMTGVVP